MTATSFSVTAPLRGHQCSYRSRSTLRYSPRLRGRLVAERGSAKNAGPWIRDMALTTATWCLRPWSSSRTRRGSPLSKRHVKLIDVAHRNLESMSERDLAAFWSTLPPVLYKRHGPIDRELEKKKLQDIINIACNRMGRFQWCRDLAQTTSLGATKTIKQVTNDSRRDR